MAIHAGGWISVRLFFDKLKDEVQGAQLTDDTNVLKIIKAAPRRAVIPI